MSEYFFPNQSPQTMRLDEKFRHLVANVDQNTRLALYEIISDIGPSFTSTAFSKTDSLTVAHQVGREIFFPSPTPVKVLSHILSGYEEWLRRKYCLPGFVEVEQGDIVIDCGGYVAGFSMSASKIASSVHVFEPDVINFDCIKRNLCTAYNVNINNSGLYSSSRRINLNVSTSSVEHSLLTPDDGATVEVREIDVYSIHDYCKKNDICALDFVKIEAEGVELEVFEGLGDTPVRKFAIDVSPERNGQSPSAQFHEILANLNYETRQRGNVLFARQSNVHD